MRITEIFSFGVSVEEFSGTGFFCYRNLKQRDLSNFAIAGNAIFSI